MIRKVEVDVVEIKTNGVLVKILEDNRVGIIRRRELSKDRRVGAIPPMPQVGERFEAEIIRDRKDAKYVYLRPVGLADPWGSVENDYHIGQVVRGEVVNVRRFGVFVQLEPGLDALIHPRDIPMLRGQWLEDVLYVGDQVQGVITDIDLKKRQIDVSLLKRLQEVSPLPPEKRKEKQIELFADKLRSGDSDTLSSVPSPTRDSEAPLRRYRQPIQMPERVLVVDDNETDLGETRNHLEEIFEFDIDGVESAKEALELVRRGRVYGLAIIDLILESEHGSKIAEQLLRLKPDLPILFVSANPLAEEDLTSINGRRYPFVIKEPDRIAEWVDMLCAGYWEDVQVENAVAYTGKGTFVRHLGMAAFARISLPQALQQLLDRLRKDTEATQCLILEVDSMKKAVSITAEDPPLEEHIRQRSLDGLYYSPVRSVVEDEEEFYQIDIDQDRDPRFRYFFRLLSFRACLGIPLTIPGMVTRHALFLLDEHRPKLELEDLDKARLAAKLIQVTLERAMLLDFMRRYEQRYSHGLLLGSFVHELSNKLDGLGGPADILPMILQRADTAKDDAERSEWLGKAQVAVEAVLWVKEELHSLIEAYSRMAKGDLEAVDVNKVADKVRLQFDAEAREKGCIVLLEQQPGLPLARAISSRLEQIIINLVLNAIQQVDRLRRTMDQTSQEKGEGFGPLQQGLIILQTKCVSAEQLYPIQIIVIDTGPGIHYNQQRDIFLLDTSTRERGHGMGLFVSRNLAETMGGRLRLVDSLMFIGSVFMVELPLFPSDGGK